jgi:hypothetical protein
VKLAIGMGSAGAVSGSDRRSSVPALFGPAFFGGIATPLGETTRGATTLAPPALAATGSPAGFCAGAVPVATLAGARGTGGSRRAGLALAGALALTFAVALALTFAARAGRALPAAVFLAG